MPATMSLHKLSFLLATILLLASLAILGCRSGYSTKGIEFYEEESGEGYKTITVMTDYYSFSFEYSTFYKLYNPRNIEPEFTITETSLGLLAPDAKVDLVVPANRDNVKTVTATFTPAHISVDVYDPTFNNREEALNATEILDWRLEGAATFDNFKLIERSLITVSGIEADYAEWEVEWIDLFPNKSEEPPMEYKWQIYFDYKGLIWWISALSSGPEYKDRIKADFDHVVKTFKILD